MNDVAPVVDDAVHDAADAGDAIATLDGPQPRAARKRARRVETRIVD